jgi:hypothetical protein
VSARELPNITLGAFAISSIDIRLEESPFVPDHVRLAITAKVMNLNGAVPGEVAIGMMLPSDVLSRRKVFADIVRARVRELVLHEIDEWLRIGGELVTDPHPELRQPVPSMTITGIKDVP